MEVLDSSATSAARHYYDCEDAHHFYATLWGGEDIHVGIYERPDESIAEASRRTVRHIARQIEALTGGNTLKVLDVGAGFGGPARWLAGNYGCSVVALDVSERQNNLNRKCIERCNLQGHVSVVQASFEQLPFPDDSFDLIWSLDSLLHTGNREWTLSEIARVARSGGDFVLTDPMQSKNCPPDALSPILARLDLDSMATPEFYLSQASARQWKVIESEDRSEQLVTHYSRLLQDMERREEELAGRVSAAFLDRARSGLRDWVLAGTLGHLRWGIFHFRT